MELKCYVSYFSRRYHLNEISYSISTNNKQKHMKLWFWIEELHVIVLKEVSFEWNVKLISAKNKHKIEKIWFGIEVLCVSFHKRVFFQWNFILISAKKKHKIEKIWFWNWIVMCHISQEGIFWMKSHSNFSQK